MFVKADKKYNTKKRSHKIRKVYLYSEISEVQDDTRDNYKETKTQRFSLRYKLCKNTKHIIELYTQNQSS